jgi:hypothetical protein
MENSYNYKVVELLRDTNDIIISASFTITVSDGVDEFTHNYNTAFANKPETPIAFNDLTEEKVIEWIKRDVGKGSEEQADAELEAYKTRISVKVGTPW